MYNKLIHGKRDNENIVSIEVEDDKAILFMETEQGLKTEEVTNKYWILASEQIDRSWVRLKGDLHYKWGKQYSDRKRFNTARHFLKHNDTYSVYDSKESFMMNYGYTYFKGMKLKDVSVLSFDIEATTLEHNENAKVLLISNTFRNSKGVIQRKLFAYDEYENPGDMFVDWCNWVSTVDPSIIIGHNIFSYDLPYLKHCASLFNVGLTLGRDGSEVKFDSYESKKRKDQTQDLHYHRAFIYGREIIDTMFLAINYDIATKKYESYGLKAIIKTENLEKEGRTFYDASQIRFNYTKPEEWLKIKEYCKDDSDDSLMLYDLMAPPFFYMTQNIPKSFQSVGYSASGSQINSIMCRSYLQEGHSLPKTSPEIEFEGAISLGNPGIYNNVFKIDVASLYPSILINYEVYDPDKDPKAYFKELVSTFTNLRLEYKKKAKEDKYYDDLQSAYKIFINSCYGFLGAAGLNFNSPTLASFVTSTGRDILTKAIRWAEEKHFKLVNADTDSISICLDDGRDFSEDSQRILEDINSLFPPRIRFEHDGFYKKIIVLKAKNYILWDGKKLKYKGSAVKASTKEPALKEFIKRIIDCILTDNPNYSDVYNEYVKEITQIAEIKRWVTRKTVSIKVLNPKRTNEQKVLDAIEDTEISEGDRIYTFFKEDGTIELVDNFDGNYDRNRLLEKLYKTSRVFTHIDNKPIGILDSKTFLNYSLKRNKTLLDGLSNGNLETIPA